VAVQAREDLRNGAAAVVADEVRALDAQRVDELTNHA
jgi:hypothetical protein